MVRKKFDKQLYDDCDAKTKQKCIEIFTILGFQLEINPDKTGVDLIARQNGEIKFFAEPEVKKVWVGPKFPYENLQIPGRKYKYAELFYPTLFIVFNSDFSNYLAIWSKDLVNSPLVEVPNKYVSHGEMFYQIQLEKTYSDVKNAIKTRNFN